ncbi:MAG: hypothetical protein JW951_08670, partial [Lentisphaerae bacterium]|nr:hypothetical protein [Lentisphaerota bacterium]
MTTGFYRAAAGLGIVIALGAFHAAADPYAQDFDTWPFTGTTGGGFPSPKFVTSSNEGWTAVNTAVGGPTDFAAFPAPASAPRAAWLNRSTTGPSEVRSPLLADGVGTVSVLSKGKTATAQIFEIQTSTNDSQWTTHATFTNTLSSAWTTNTVDINIYAVLRLRIRKTDDTGAVQEWLGLDNIAVSLPPPPVALSNPQRDPAEPAETEYVTFRIDAAPDPGISNITCYVRFRHEFDTAYGTQQMEPESGDTYVGTVPPGPAGSMFYYYECFAEGFTSPARFPEAGAADPLVYTNTAGLGTGREQDFDTWPFTGKISGGFGGIATPIYTNSTHDGWTALDASISGNGEISSIPVAASPPHACWFAPLADGGEPMLITPLLTGGVSRIFFSTRGHADLVTQTFNIERSPTGG